MQSPKRSKVNASVECFALPIEIWSVVLQNLSIRDIPNVSVVCKKWNTDIIQSNSFWNIICGNSIPASVKIQQTLKGNWIDVAKSVYTKRKENSKRFCRLCGSPGQWCALASCNMCETCKCAQKLNYISAAKVKLYYDTNISTIIDEYPIRTAEQKKLRSRMTVYLVKDVEVAVQHKRKMKLEETIIRLKKYRWVV